MQLHVGTSGYSYKEWKGTFYPRDIDAGSMLAYYAGRFDTVEINNTFYRMPSTKAVAAWGDAVPSGFRFVLKAPRRITHIQRLRDVGESVAHLFDAASLLGEKRGPLLFQFPPFFRKDIERLRVFLELVPEGQRVALEFRNRGWHDDEVRELLRSKGAALCVTDDGKPGDAGVAEAIPELTCTTNWGYLRLRDEGYDDARLRLFADAILAQPWEEAFVFFKHEDEGKGPEMAARFRELAEGEARGRPAT